MNNIRRVELICDVGSAKDHEDGYFCQYPLFAVFDGVSAPYSQSHPMQRYGEYKLSGGAMVVKEACQELNTISNLQTELPLEQITELVNLRVRELQEKNWGMLIDRPDLLAGATFAIAKITDNLVEILQAGDSFVLWSKTNGEIGITRDQLSHFSFKFDALLKKIQAKHLKLCGEITKARMAAWDEYYRFRVSALKKYVNNPSYPHHFGLLNGQAGLRNCWFYTRIPKSELRYLLLFTDGLIDSAELRKDKKMFKRQLLNEYSQSGLSGILQKRCVKEQKEKTRNWVDYSEATAIAIEF